jgi:hypothetical protein
MKTRTAATLALLFSCTLARHAAAYVVDGSTFLYTEENSAGYRRLTSAEPAAGNTVPLSYVTVIPASDRKDPIEISYQTTESLETDKAASTLILHTNITLEP